MFLFFLPVAFWLGGSSAAIGFSFGSLAVAFNLVVLRFTVALFGQSLGESKKRAGSTFLILAFFLKLPLYVFAGWYVNRIGNNAPPCFLGGVALVYFVMVWWSLTQR